MCFMVSSYRVLCLVSVHLPPADSGNVIVSLTNTHADYLRAVQFLCDLFRVAEVISMCVGAGYAFRQLSLASACFAPVVLGTAS